MIKKYLMLNEGDSGFLIYDYETERWKASRCDGKWVLIEADETLIIDYQKARKSYDLIVQENISNLENQLNNLYEAFKNEEVED